MGMLATFRTRCWVDPGVLGEMSKVNLFDQATKLDEAGSIPAKELISLS